MDRMRTRIEGNTENSAMPNASTDDDPFGVELDRLDVLDSSEMSNKSLKDFMFEVIESKRTLLEDSKLVCKLLKLDQLSSSEGGEKRTVKRIKKPKMVKRYNVDDEDEDVIIQQFDDNEAPVVKIENDGKGAEEEMTDEEMPVDELEEENDYMDSYFDNGEDFID